MIQPILTDSAGVVQINGSVSLIDPPLQTANNVQATQRYLIRRIHLVQNLSIPGGTGITIISLYTVPANTQCNLRYIYMRIGATTSMAQFGCYIQTGGAQNVRLCEGVSEMCGVRRIQVERDLLLEAGVALQLVYYNMDPVARLLLVQCQLNEFDV